jgi:hypothetical protein
MIVVLLVWISGSTMGVVSGHWHFDCASCMFGILFGVVGAVMAKGCQ